MGEAQRLLRFVEFKRFCSLCFAVKIYLLTQDVEVITDGCRMYSKRLVWRSKDQAKAIIYELTLLFLLTAGKYVSSKNRVVTFPISLYFPAVCGYCESSIPELRFWALVAFFFFFLDTGCLQSWNEQFVLYFHAEDTVTVITAVTGKEKRQCLTCTKIP